MQIETTEKREPFYFSESELVQGTVLEDGRGVCKSCEGVHLLNAGVVDIMITKKLSFDNVRAKVCSNCGHPIHFEASVLEDLRDNVLAFKSSRPSINELLDRSRSDSYRWCENTVCGCMGAANCAGGLSAYLYTKEDWIRWKDLNPERKDKFMFWILNFNNRINAINALRKEFHIGAKDAANILNNNPMTFGIEYYDGSQDDIDEDVDSLLKRFKEQGVLLEKIEVFQPDYIFMTFGRDMDV